MPNRVFTDLRILNLRMHTVSANYSVYSALIEIHIDNINSNTLHSSIGSQPTSNIRPIQNHHVHTSIGTCLHIVVVYTYNIHLRSPGYNGHLSVAFRLQLQSQATISCRHHEGSRTTEIFFLQNAYNINKSMGVMSDAKKKTLVYSTHVSKNV